MIGFVVVVGCSRPTDAWIDDLDDPSELTRRLAALALREAPDRDARDAMLALTRATTDRRGSVARAAVESLRVRHDDAVPLLLTWFEDPQTPARDRRAIVAALSGIGVEAARAILRRVPAIANDGDRLELARAIARSPDSAHALPLLLDAMREQPGAGSADTHATDASQVDATISPRSFATLTLSLALAERTLPAGSDDTGDGTPTPDALRDALIQATSDENPSIRTYAVRGLARLAALDDRALRAIEDVLESAERPSLRRTAILALAPHYVAAIADRANDPDTAAHADTALDRCGDAAIPAFVEVLRRDDPHHAVIAANRLVASGRTAVGPLLDLLAEEDFANTMLVVDTFARIGVPAVDELVEALRVGLWRVRPTAAAALGRIPAGAGRSVPALAELLDDENRPIRIAAILALAQLLPASLPTEDAVREAAATVDRNPAVDAAIGRFEATRRAMSGG